MTRPAVDHLLRLGTRRPGPLGAALLVPTWLVLGLLVLGWVVGIMLLGFAAVLVATVRLLLSPLLALLAHRPGARRRA